MSGASDATVSRRHYCLERPPRGSARKRERRGREQERARDELFGSRRRHCLKEALSKGYEGLQHIKSILRKSWMVAFIQIVEHNPKKATSTSLRNNSMTFRNY